MKPPSPPSSTGEREAQTAFLAELVKVPSDNPPGDCAAHAERAADAPGGAGLHGRAAPRARRAGPRQRHDQLHQPRRPPPLRRGRPGDRAERPRRRGAARRGLDPRPLRCRDRRRLDVRPRRRGLEVRLRHLRLGAPGARGSGGPARGSPARSSCTSPTTRRPAARSGPAGCSSRASAGPISRSAPASPTPWSPPTMAACTWRCRSTAARRTPPCPSPASTRSRPPRTSYRELYRLAEDAGAAAAPASRASAARSSRSA